MRTTSVEPQQHDLVGWYRVATSQGLTYDERVARNIRQLNELHQDAMSQS
jgi:hypothetical protein